MQLIVSTIGKGNSNSEVDLGKIIEQRIAQSEDLNRTN